MGVGVRISFWCAKSRAFRHDRPRTRTEDRPGHPRRHKPGHAGLAHARPASLRAAQRKSRGGENFPHRKALKTHETGKESRFLRGAPSTGRRNASRKRRRGRRRSRSGFSTPLGGLRMPSAGSVAPHSRGRARPRGKFSASQSLENSQNGERISTRYLELRGQFPQLRRGRGATPAPGKFLSPCCEGNCRAGRGS